MLCVNNLSRFPQPIELNLQHWNGYTPVEMTGYVEFPAIGQLPYLLTLPGPRFLLVRAAGTEEPGMSDAANLPFDEWLVRSSAGTPAATASCPSAEPARLSVAARRPRPGAARRRPTPTDRPERYQVIVRWDTGPIEEYADVATIGADEDRTAYDALYNPADAKYLLSLVDSSATVGDVRFGKEPDVAPADWTPRRGCRAPSRATPASSSRNRPSSRCSAASRRASTRTSN